MSNRDTECQECKQKERDLRSIRKELENLRRDNESLRWDLYDERKRRNATR